MALNFKIFRDLVFKLILILFALSILWVLVYKWFTPPVTLHMIERRAKAAQAKKANPRIRYNFVNLEDVAPNVPLAIMAAEDQLFMTHDGFDYKAMKGAFQKNQKSKKIVGGSTISQQVAKNVFLWHGRSYIRKLVEAYFTMLIEIFWSKHRIMEVYINIAETGDQVFGVEAAAQKYFNTSAKNLTASQAALIASVLPNPIRFSVKNPSAFTLKKRRVILRNMRQMGGTTSVKLLMQGAI
ncbi:monofunctional biosynthetic peptidoglycan transglycosylase [Adhaeribacter swui]|uniref:Biosynthetic peptidoglycan transglycosylase n=1 Tax=Adhaeribacter swui TaxID=2086471 RepID=A0A7G7GCZ8_9BACT|nr:monofunctional biosynthetic peptidoglycan transglycosylase [Adhaeribacter swui]QNF35032.1 monofunctional biosynthetic peptidoglycan transglycosylase [Adhaeribacter swui]